MPKNPFAFGHYYVNPSYREHIRGTMDMIKGTSDSERHVRAALESLIDVPSAYWLDTKARITGSGSTDTLEGILADAAQTPNPPLCVFIVCEPPPPQPPHAHAPLSPAPRAPRQTTCPIAIARRSRAMGGFAASICPTARATTRRSTNAPKASRSTGAITSIRRPPC